MDILSYDSFLPLLGFLAASGGEEEKETGAQPQTPVKGQLPLASPFATNR
ncbi:MAG: hypothetical protein ABI465_06860 [Ktedonobacteraceae bacterium]